MLPAGLLRLTQDLACQGWTEYLAHLDCHHHPDTLPAPTHTHTLQQPGIPGSGGGSPRGFHRWTQVTCWGQMPQKTFDILALCKSDYYYYSVDVRLTDSKHWERSQVIMQCTIIQHRAASNTHCQMPALLTYFKHASKTNHLHWI